MFRRGADDKNEWVRETRGVSSVGWKLQTGRAGSLIQAGRMEWEEEESSGWSQGSRK